MKTGIGSLLCFTFVNKIFHLICTPQVYHTTQGTPDCDGEREILPDLREQQARPSLRQQDTPSGYYLGYLGWSVEVSTL